MSNSADREAFTRNLTQVGVTNPQDPDYDPSFYDKPPYQPGGYFYEKTPAGQQEAHRRLILAHTYQPGDILLVDYVFGSYSEPIPPGVEVKFQGWREYAFAAGDENLIYQPGPDNQPGIFRDYSGIRVEYEDEIVTLADYSVTLAATSLAQTRIDDWGNKEIPRGLVRVGDLPTIIKQVSPDLS